MISQIFILELHDNGSYSIDNDWFGNKIDVSSIDKIPLIIIYTSHYK